MACAITLKGLDFGCRDNVGGLKNVWMADWSAAKPSLTAEGAYTATAGAFKIYKIRTGNSSLTTTVNVDVSNGTTYCQNDINIILTKLSEEYSKEAGELIKGNLAIIVEDRNGNYFGMGLDNPATLSAGTVQSGQAMSDLSGYNLTFTDYSKDLPHSVDPTIITDLPTSVE